MQKARFEAPVACDVALWIINHQPGLTVGELAFAMWGRTYLDADAYQQVRLIESKGLVETRGSPVRIYPRILAHRALA